METSNSSDEEESPNNTKLTNYENVSSLCELFKYNK